MLSLGFWIVFLILGFVTDAVALSWAARAVGSSRRGLKYGLLAAAVLTAAHLALAAVSFAVQSAVASSGMGAVLVVSVLLLVVQLAVDVVILRRVFGLSAGRAFAPIGATVAVAILFLGLAFGLVRPLVTEAFVMPTESMGPTIARGDRFFVNKRLTPRRWDCVAYFVTLGNEPRMVYCKRLVGLPGERLRFENGDLYVNDVRQTAPPVVAGQYTMDLAPPGRPRMTTRYRDGETVRLGPDEYYLVGDAVAISGDSRMNGPSTRADLIGVVDLRYWPPGRAGVLR